MSCYYSFPSWASFYKCMLAYALFFCSTHDDCANFVSEFQNEFINIADCLWRYPLQICKQMRSLNQITPIHTLFCMATKWVRSKTAAPQHPRSREVPRHPASSYYSIPICASFYKRMLAFILLFVAQCVTLMQASLRNFKIKFQT